jgi:hypothetical protein
MEARVICSEEFCASRTRHLGEDVEALLIVAAEQA